MLYKSQFKFNKWFVVLKRPQWGCNNKMLENPSV